MPNAICQHLCTAKRVRTVTTNCTVFYHTHYEEKIMSRINSISGLGVIFLRGLWAWALLKRSSHRRPLWGQQVHHHVIEVRWHAKCTILSRVITLSSPASNSHCHCHCWRRVVKCDWQKVNGLGYIYVAEMVAKSKGYVMTPVAHGGTTTIYTNSNMLIGVWA